MWTFVELVLNLPVFCLFRGSVYYVKAVGHFASSAAIQNLERETRHWPMVFNDTVVFSMSQVRECCMVGRKLECILEPVLCLGHFVCCAGA